METRLSWRDNIGTKINEVDFNNFICTNYPSDGGSVNSRPNVFGSITPYLQNYTKISK